MPFSEQTDSNCGIYKVSGSRLCRFTDYPDCFYSMDFYSLQAHAAKEWHPKLGHTVSFHIPSYSQINIIR